jgi:hypothetical protein
VVVVVVLLIQAVQFQHRLEDLVEALGGTLEEEEEGLVP